MADGKKYFQMKTGMIGLMLCVLTPYLLGSFWWIGIGIGLVLLLVIGPRKVNSGTDRLYNVGFLTLGLLLANVAKLVGFWPSF